MQETNETVNQRCTVSKDDLSNFSGTLNYWQHAIPGIVLSDGAQYLCTAGAAWLVDAIAACQTIDLQLACDNFQAWEVKVNPDKSCMLQCSDGNYNVKLTQEINFTDLTVESLNLLVQPTILDGKQVQVIFLSSEY